MRWQFSTLKCQQSCGEPSEVSAWWLLRKWTRSAGLKMCVCWQPLSVVHQVCLNGVCACVRAATQPSKWSPKNQSEAIQPRFPQNLTHFTLTYWAGNTEWNSIQRCLMRPQFVRPCNRNTVSMCAKERIQTSAVRRSGNAKSVLQTQKSPPAL